MYKGKKMEEGKKKLQCGERERWQIIRFATTFYALLGRMMERQTKVFIETTLKYLECPIYQIINTASNTKKSNK